MKEGISLIIPTYNGGQVFAKCLEMIGQQDYGGKIQLVVVDSGSTDGTIELAERAGALIKKIDRRTFHHAHTRNEAVLLANFNSIVFTVQDAIPCSTSWLSALERSLCETGVAAVYTDQIPHDDVTPYSRFEIESISKARGGKQKIQKIESLQRFNEMPYEEAYRSIGLDNVCAIYRKELLINIPFPEVGFAEDIAWAFKNMPMGYKILYQPDIKVKHSHDRSPEYAFNRQVVNSFWCAKIMNRVRDDMSFLTIEDLMALTNRVRRFVNRLGSDILEKNEALDKRHEKSFQVFNRIQKKYSLRNRAKCFLADKFLKNSNPQFPEVKAIEQQSEEGIRHVLKLVEREYQVTDEQELIEVLEQCAANTLGRIYGETYASYVLSRRTSPQLERFFKPYLRGI